MEQFDVSNDQYCTYCMRLTVWGYITISGTISGLIHYLKAFKTRIDIIYIYIEKNREQPLNNPRWKINMLDTLRPNSRMEVCNVELLWPVSLTLYLWLMLKTRLETRWFICVNKVYVRRDCCLSMFYYTRVMYHMVNQTSLRGKKLGPSFIKSVLFACWVWILTVLFTRLSM